MPSVYPVLDFDEIYVVSDLHLGGSKAELQIFASSDVFKGLIDLINLPSDKRVGLIINGDFIDFLAQPSNDKSVAYFDPVGAEEKLSDIITQFGRVWSALQDFLKTPNRMLTINIGNHDLELALPWVQEHLGNFLTMGNDSARAQLRMEMDGCGILYKVGNTNVLCVHGNDVDPWNSVDQGKLSRIIRDLVRSGKYDPWIPNGGSKLVIDVINELKQHFHFVDLLKPEGLAVFNFLHALGAELADKTGDVAKAKILFESHRMQMKAGLLGLGVDQTSAFTIGASLAESPKKLDRTLSQVTMNFLEPVDKVNFGKSLLEEANDQFNNGIKPLDLLSPDGVEDSLRLDDFLHTINQTVGNIFNKFQHVGHEIKLKVLRETLKLIVKNDESFSLTYEDDTYQELNKKVSDDIHILIAGHTHLERAIQRPGGNIYFNTGTWARLMQITESHLNPGTFEKNVYEPMSQNSMQALDDANLTIKKHSVVKIYKKDNKVFAELAHCEKNNNNGWDLNKVPEAYTFTKQQ